MSVRRSGVAGNWDYEGNTTSFSIRLPFAVFLAFTLLTLLILRPLWPVNIIWIQRLVLFLLLLRHILPERTLLGRQTLPLLAYLFRQISLALPFNRSGHGLVHRRCRLVHSLLAVLAALASEEDERILGSLNVILVALLRSSLVITGYRSTTPIRCLRGRGRR